MMKVIASAIAAIFDNPADRTAVVDLFACVPVHAKGGGMTLDVGNGPIVVCYDRPSLADEKSLRHDLGRQLGNNVKLSRTSNVDQRCEQYPRISN